MNGLKKVSFMNKTIFISHRTTDKAVADMLLDFLVTTGIPRESIKCSSLPGNDVKERIAPEIRTWIQQSAVNVAILSDNYYKSAYCLNEAGVIWYLEDIPIIPIALPEITHNNMIGFLDSDYKLRKLDSDDDIAYIYDTVQENLQLPAARHSVITAEIAKLKERYKKFCENRIKNCIANNEEAESVDYGSWLENENCYVDGYHELHDRDGHVVEKGQYVNGKLVDGISFNIILKVSKDKDLDEEPEPTEEEAENFDGYDYDCWKIRSTEDPIAQEDLEKGEWHYSEFGRYDAPFVLLTNSSYIKGIGLEYFYVVDKKVTIEGEFVKPTFTNFRTLESVLAEKEPEELEYIKTGIRKYDETGYAEI